MKHSGWRAIVVTRSRLKSLNTPAAPAVESFGGAFWSNGFKFYIDLGRYVKVKNHEFSALYYVSP